MNATNPCVYVPSMTLEKKNSSYKEIKQTAIQYEEQQKYSVQSLIYVITGQVLRLRKARLLGTTGEGRPPGRQP